jgi:hypothetical protein
MASAPPGLVFKMILSPSAAMFTACASVAHGVVVGLEVQAVSSHKTKQQKALKTTNEGKKKPAKLTPTNQLCLGRDHFFCCECQQYLNCDYKGRNLQKKSEPSPFGAIRMSAPSTRHGKTKQRTSRARPMRGGMTSPRPRGVEECAIKPTGSPAFLLSPPPIASFQLLHGEKFRTSFNGVWVFF